MRLTLSFLFILLVDLAFAQIQFQQHEIMDNEISNGTSTMAADLNNDGYTDLLVASYDIDRISWFENDGLGNFVDHHIITDECMSVVSIFTIDLDNDGDIDIVSASQGGADLISWYENLGGGEFGIQQVISDMVDGACDVFSIDLDNDGDSDVISASTNDNKVAWYENLGNGNFGSQHVLSTNFNILVSVFGADLDGDGKNDILTASIFDNKICWFENLGNGLFNSEQIISNQAYGGKKVYAADLDGDSDLDVLSLSSNEHKLAWYENLGAGIFGNQQVITTQHMIPSDLCVNDLDNDGDNDIVLGLLYIVGTVWFENDGLGNFEPLTYIDSTFAARSISVADFNSDGYLDVSATSSNSFFWYANDSLSNFGVRQSVSFALNLIDVVYLTDFNNNGKQDIFTGSGNVVSYFKNLSNGQFVFADSISLSTRPGDIATSDFNGDTNEDLLICNNQLQWCENTNTGEFGALHLISDSVDGGVSVSACDINGDGDVDALVGATMSKRVSWWENDGLGNFGSENIISVFQDHVNVIATADLDGDNDMDVVTGADDLYWHENDGSGNFTTHTLSSLVFRTLAIHIADIDNDGDKDVISGEMTSISNGALRLFKNDGLGNFNAMSTIAITVNRQDCVFSGDIDLDGDLDIISQGNSWASSIEWYENDGQGNFGPAQHLADSAEVYSIFASDLDNDGDIDLAYQSWIDDKVLWSENLGYQSFDSAQACQEDTLLFAGHAITTPGTYYDSLQSVYGLDSIVELNFSHIPAPIVQLQLFPADTVCIEEDFALLPFATPFGGIYQSNGVVGNQLDLYAAGLGMQELIYTYTDTLTGCSNSDSTAIEIVQCLLVEQIGAALNCKVFPNPTSGLLFIELPETEGEATLIQLFDGRGQALYSNTLVSKSATLKLQAYPPGIYYLKIQSGKSIEVRKVILN